MRILHTSDWHLGAYLHDQSRIPEQGAFLEWLKVLMRKERPDALIIAGDIFDSCAPSNAALNLYYNFLSVVYRDSLCRTVVVIGGNHDSPSLLDAPGNVLTHLKTHVVGSVDSERDGNGGSVTNYGKETVVVLDGDGKPGLVIGAVPYLRDSDLRTSEALETDAARTEKLKRGFVEHYASVASLAHQQAALPDGRRLPFILMGHLFLTGATTADEKSERDLQVGNLGSLEMALLPEADYYALGHLHNPQSIGGREICRYSGSPIPMSFGEVRQSKSVVLVDFTDNAPPDIRTEPVPRARKIVQLKGSPEVIEAGLNEQLASRESVWVDIQITEGEGDAGPWRNKFEAAADRTPVMILRCQNARPGKSALALAAAVLDETKLEHITPRQLFDMRIQDEMLTDEERREYSAMFDEIVRVSGEADINKE